jgi:hypothetical protein
MTTGRKNLSHVHKSCRDLLRHGLGESTLVATVNNADTQQDSSRKKSAPLTENTLETVRIKARPDLSLTSNIVSAEIRFKTIPNGNFCELRIHHA